MEGSLGKTAPSHPVFPSGGLTTVNCNTSAGSTEHIESYATVRSALIADKTSADDTTATANLQAGSALTMLINRTSNSPNGSGSATPYVDSDGDANNTTISMNSANAKALGLLAGNDPIVDAAITFNNNSAFNFDFDPTNGIAAGFYDFIGIATHEIGHALGFVSGVDILDFYSQPRRGGPFPDDQFTFVSTLDLFRYSALSKANSAIDWTADNRVKFFSIDGGTTMGASFSNGVNFGDGQQASHWKDNLGLGIMDPTAGRGELLSITANDIRAFDVIGYNLNNSSVAVPEPSSIALWGLGALGIAFARRYRK